MRFHWKGPLLILNLNTSLVQTDIAQPEEERGTDKISLRLPSGDKVRNHYSTINFSFELWLLIDTLGGDTPRPNINITKYSMCQQIWQTGTYGITWIEYLFNDIRQGDSWSMSGPYFTWTGTKVWTGEILSGDDGWITMLQDNAFKLITAPHAAINSTPWQ